MKQQFLRNKFAFATTMEAPADASIAAGTTSNQLSLLVKAVAHFQSLADDIGRRKNMENSALRTQLCQA